MEPRPPNLLALLDEVQAIARSGLAFVESPFDRERYERLVALAAAAYGQILELPAAEVRQRWARELGHVTPKVGAEAAVFDDQGRILVFRRTDDNCWGLPGGWLEPNESPAEAAVREAREETGIEVRVVELLDVFTRSASAEDGLQGAVAAVYLCEPVGGQPRDSAEGTQVGYRPVAEITDWHGWHREHAAAALARWRQLHPGSGG